MKSVKDFVYDVAARNNWKVIDDSEFLSHLLEGLEKNFKNYGYYLCPCREGWEDNVKDRDITCACQYAAGDIKAHGHCYCGLFVSEEFDASGELPSSIPDQRPDDRYPD